MPSKVKPVGQPLPLLATPRLAGDEPVGALAHLVGGQQLAAREHDDALERVRRPLVVDRELAEAIDLVAPQVDAHGRVGGRREDVDDRAAHRDLAAMLDLILTAVARVHEAADELVAVAALADLDLDRLDLLDVGAEALDERPDRRDDHVGRPVGLEQPPDRAQAAAHRLDPGAHPLERQRLPRGEQVDAVGAEERREVVGEALAVGRGGDGDEVRPALRGLDEAGDRERPSGLGYGDERARPPPNFEKGGVVAQQLRKIKQAHRRSPKATAAFRHRNQRFGIETVRGGATWSIW